jgi:hypothetical protein
LFHCFPDDNRLLRQHGPAFPDDTSINRASDISIVMEKGSILDEFRREIIVVRGNSVVPGSKAKAHTRAFDREDR